MSLEASSSPSPAGTRRTPLESWIAAKIGHPGERPTPEILQAYQVAALNETLRLAHENSRFYRKLLGSRPPALHSLDELGRLPLTNAGDLRAARLDWLCVRQDEVERIVTLPTSGTTGPPKRIYFTGADQELTRDFFHHGMSTLVAPGDRVLILLPGSLPGSVGDLLKDGLERMNVAGIPHGPVADPRETLAVIRREAVTALVGIPVQVLALARTALCDPGGVPPTIRSVLLSTDRVPGVVAGVIESVFGCAVYNHYGTTEMGLGGGVDCVERCGYHLREADLLFEVVDPATGLPVPEGAYGEVVFSTLTRRAMPFIRYRTGDRSRFVPEPCPCGTVLRRLAHVDERLGTEVVLPSGETVHQRELDEALFAVHGLLDFRAILAREGEKATLTIEVKSIDGAPEAAVIENALLTIPQLEREAGRARLLLHVQGWQPGDGYGTGTQKRQIVQQGGTE